MESFSFATVNFRIFSSPEKEAWCSLVNTPSFLVPKPSAATSLLSCLYRLVYSGFSHKWSYTTCAFLCLASFTQHAFRVPLSCGLYQHFIPFIANNISSYGYATLCLSPRQLVDVWLVSTFWLLWTRASVGVLASFLCRHEFSFLLGEYSGVGLLGQMVALCLAFWGTCRLFSEVVEPCF